MTDQHPITPPPELVQQWAYMLSSRSDHAVFSLAARWGSDQELKACCDYIGGEGKWFANPWHRLAELRAARRPKPPSPKEEALRVLENLIETRRIVDPEYQALRHALEALPND